MNIDWLTKQKIAHRGLFNDKFPENSLPAFKNACKHNFAIELDVHDISDNNIIVFHDTTLNRMCGINKKVKDLKTEELENCYLLNTNYTIPTLKEVLDVVDGKVPIIIELKIDTIRETLSQKVYQIIKDYKGPIAVKSFNHFTILWFKKHAPHIIRGMLGSSLKDMKLPRIYKWFIRNLYMFNFIKPHFISYNFDDLPYKNVSKRKVPILTWTIKNSNQEKQALQIADNIIFDSYIPDKSQIGV